MFHLALWEPEIPPNAGNVARLCAATNTTLHFVGRLGFRLDDKTLKRAGLDYWPHVIWKRHETWDQFIDEMTIRIPLSPDPSPSGKRGGSWCASCCGNPSGEHRVLVEAAVATGRETPRR